MRITKKQALIIGGCLLLTAAIAVGVFLLVRHDNQPEPVTGTPTINYLPATKEEKAEAERHKDELVKEAQQAKDDDAAPGSTKAITPVITSAYTTDDNVVVSAIISGVFEDGGSCTATLTQGSSKVTGTSQGFANATTTDCQTISIPRSSFPKTGEWQVVVTYSSKAATGTSAPKAVRL